MKLYPDLNNIKGWKKLTSLNNKYVLEIIKKYALLCKPDKISILTGTKEDISYVRQKALEQGEEIPLSISGHTAHFDGINDQGRDKEKTKILLPAGVTLGNNINTGERTSHLKEIFDLLDNSMQGKEMYVLFYCLGPTRSSFSIPALQITDSAYVAHSENILYRQGYGEFLKLKGSKNFFHFIHSSGKLDNGISKNYEKKRIYIDLKENRVLSINTQYGGNSMGLKKLALRLAIKKASQKGWLCEHMLLIGVKPLKGKRVSYFSGAFPSACGKTSTAMVPGQTILGDDIAYIKPGKNGYPCAVNIEQGIFGIIEDINPADDPSIYSALTTPRELIFSNILVSDKKPYWLGMGKKLPKKGINFAGKWFEGMKDALGKPVTPSHKNARYTIRLEDLPNVDKHLHSPLGVSLSGIIYGGRDSDTSPPVYEAFNWFHGVFMGASLESETTAATLGETGVRKHNPLANLDFLVIPLSLYMKLHLNLAKKLKHIPRVFTTNYFLKENGEFLNKKIDKKIWLLWMEGRVHNEFSARATPIGYIPRFSDLHDLFWAVWGRVYSREDYEKQFSVRIINLLEKLDRIEKIFSDEKNIPEMIFLQINQQRERLLSVKNEFKKNLISPFAFHIV